MLQHLLPILGPTLQIVIARHKYISLILNIFCYFNEIIYLICITLLFFSHFFMIFFFSFYLGKWSILKINCLNHPFLYPPLFFIIDEMMPTFLDSKWIQRIEKDFFFMNKTTMLANICAAIVNYFISLLLFHFYDKEQVVCKFGSGFWVSAGWKKPEIKDYLAHIIPVELYFFFTCSGPSVANQLLVWFR